MARRLPPVEEDWRLFAGQDSTEARAYITRAQPRDGYRPADAEHVSSGRRLVVPVTVNGLRSPR